MMNNYNDNNDYSHLSFILMSKGNLLLAPLFCISDPHEEINPFVFQVRLVSLLKGCFCSNRPQVCLVELKSCFIPLHQCKRLIVKKAR